MALRHHVGIYPPSPRLNALAPPRRAWSSCCWLQRASANVIHERQQLPPHRRARGRRHAHLYFDNAPADERCDPPSGAFELGDYFSAAFSARHQGCPDARPGAALSPRFPRSPQRAHGCGNDAQVVAVRRFVQPDPGSTGQPMVAPMCSAPEEGDLPIDAYSRNRYAPPIPAHSPRVSSSSR